MMTLCVRPDGHRGSHEARRTARRGPRAAEPGRFPRALALAVHELRTPVAVVSGYLRMLISEQAGAITDVQRAMLEETAESCARIGALIGEMSELKELESADWIVPNVPLDLAALIGELASGLVEEEDSGARLDVRAAGPVMVAGDRTRLSAALRALIHAALREQGETGVIVVECSTSLDDDQMWAVVTIGDETVTRSLIECARDASFADEWRGGLGLALPIGRCVIEAHGGAVWSAPGLTPRAGSALRLPLATSRPAV